MHPDYEADIAAFEAIETDRELLEFIDRRIVAALPKGWTVTIPYEIEDAGDGTPMAFRWIMVPEGPEARRRMQAGDRPHYYAFLIDRKRLAFVYGNTDAGMIGAMWHSETAELIQVPYLASVLEHIFARPEVFPVNDSGLT